MTPYDLDAVSQDLVQDEGLRLKPYTDTVGKLTIGVGRNLTDVGLRLSEAMLLLSNDLAAVVTGLSTRLPWFVRLDPMRQRVLLNMAFNLGVNGLLTFHQMLADVERGDYDGAADQMVASRWAGQVKDRANRLAHMMRTGTVSV